jgi:hypothetical protein
MNFDHSRRRQIDERPCLEGQELVTCAYCHRVEALHVGQASALQLALRAFVSFLIISSISGF